MRTFRQLTLSHQFLIASFPILVLGMLVVGLWVTREIEQGVVNRLGSVTSLYVDSLVAPHLQQILQADALAQPQRAALDALLTDTPLGQKIVAFNIWRRDGRVLYSTDEEIIGKAFLPGPGLRVALSGDVYSKTVARTALEHGFEGSDWPPQMIETYAPVHAETSGDVIGVAEFYQTTDELRRETDAARNRTWLVVATTMLAMYALLFGLVRRGSQTIDRQRRELHDRVAELSSLLARNAQLDVKVRGAAARATALNERFLRRISADLHDGPGQDLGYALMRLDTLEEHRASAPALGAAAGTSTEDFRAIRSGVSSALDDLRAISAGLQLPELEALSIEEVAARAIRDFERKTGATVTALTDNVNAEVSLPVKIALYRLLQESLANGYRHGNGVKQRVVLALEGDQLIVQISDQGPGFDGSMQAGAGHLGLVGMRERVEALGGSFELRAMPGQGTCIRATLPTHLPGAEIE